MKKKYIPPQSRTILLPSPVVMLSGSNTVSEYGDSYDVMIGDNDSTQ